MILREDKKIYFASDFHLGAKSYNDNSEREKIIVSWLDSIKIDAQEIYLVGDLFDFWFEYKYVIPKYFVRFIGKLAELSDMGITINIFHGNHDMWMFDYFQKELNANIIPNSLEVEINRKIFYIAHGDGLGPKDYGYKFIKMIFRSKISIFLFTLLPSKISFGLANYLSSSSRKYKKELISNDVEKEWMIIYSKNLLKHKSIDYFIYGHRHKPMIEKLSDKSTFINLGDWINNYTYSVFDGKEILLKRYEK